MSDGSAERVQAAATGAAAAVAAVEDEQAEQERTEAMEASTEAATGAAAQAAAQAEQAAEAAEAAAEAATEASAEAGTAGQVATEAATEAYDIRTDLEQLREENRQGWQAMRTYLDERFAPPTQDQEPTEVTVTHESRADTSSESGDNPGGGGSAGNEPGTTARPGRHRFGRSRG